MTEVALAKIPKDTLGSSPSPLFEIPDQVRIMTSRDSIGWTLRYDVYTSNNDVNIRRSYAF
jgi:hypothetical protein